MLPILRPGTGNREPGTVLTVPSFRFLLSAFCAALFVLAPKTALATICSPDARLDSMNAYCDSSCTGDGKTLASNLINVVPENHKQKILTAICGGGSCCVDRGNELCNQAAKWAGFTAGNCKAICVANETPSQSSNVLCSSNSNCCMQGAAPAAVVGQCATLPGTTSACKASAGADELDLTSSMALATYIGSPGCPNQVCAVKKGSELCAAFAKVGKQEGAYACFATGDCEKPLAGEFGQQGTGACPSGKTCCIGKAGAAAAKPGKPGSPVTLPDPLSGLNFPRLIGNVIRTFSGIAGSLALLMFVYGGIMWILSGGESGKVQKAQKILVNAAIGLVLIFSAYTFVSSIVDTILQPAVKSAEEETQ